MFRIWGKMIKENHLLKDTVICIPDKDLSRTKKVYKALEMICDEFDLAVPVWLDTNKNDFLKHSRTRFDKSSFMEEIDFDYPDFQLIEEDFPWV